MEFVNTGPLLNEEMYDLFLSLNTLDSQKEWIQVTQEIESQLEEKYSLDKYQKAEQHWMTIFFVLNYLLDLLPFQYQGEVVASLLTRPTTKRRHWLLTLWTSDQWPSAVAEPIIKALDYHHDYLFHSKVLGYRPLHIITRFGERDLFSRLHLSVTELYTRHVGCHMGVHNHFLERVPAFGCSGLFSSVKTFQRKYFNQYSSYVCGTCEQISIREVNGPANEHQGHEIAEGSWYKNEDLIPPPVSEKDREFARADDNRKRQRKAQYKENCAKRHREHSQEESN